MSAGGFRKPSGGYIRPLLYYLSAVAPHAANNTPAGAAMGDSDSLPGGHGSQSPVDGVPASGRMAGAGANVDLYDDYEDLRTPEARRLRPE